MIHFRPTRNIPHGGSGPGGTRYDVPEGTKYCPTCETVKAHAYFKTRKASPGFHSECKKCSEWQRRSPARRALAAAAQRRYMARQRA